MAQLLYLLQGYVVLSLLEVPVQCLDPTPTQAEELSLLRFQHTSSPAATAALKEALRNWKSRLDTSPRELMVSIASWYTICSTTCSDHYKFFLCNLTAAAAALGC